MNITGREPLPDRDPCDFGPVTFGDKVPSSRVRRIDVYRPDGFGGRTTDGIRAILARFFTRRTQTAQERGRAKARAIAKAYAKRHGLLARMKKAVWR